MGEGRFGRVIFPCDWSTGYLKGRKVRSKEAEDRVQGR